MLDKSFHIGVNPNREPTTQDIEVYVCFRLRNATDEQLEKADAVHWKGSLDESPMWQLEKTFERQLGIPYGDYQIEYYLNVIPKKKGKKKEG